MMSESNLAKRYLGVKFGYGEPIKDGVYAIPTDTSKGEAFMKMQIENGTPAGNENFKLFWDEELISSWYDDPQPAVLKESAFASAFRAIEKLI